MCVVFDCVAVFCRYHFNVPRLPVVVRTVDSASGQISLLHVACVAMPSLDFDSRELAQLDLTILNLWGWSGKKKLIDTVDKINTSQVSALR